MACRTLITARVAWSSGALALAFSLVPLFSNADAERQCAGVIPGEGPHAYRFRGDRCEGFLRQEVAAEPKLLSLTVGQIAAPTTPASISLEWEGTASRAVKLSARVLKQDVYYQMDAPPAPTIEPFVWSTQVLYEAGLGGLPLGFRAVMQRETEQRGDGMLFVPVRLASSAQVSAGNVTADYVALLVCDTEIRSIEVAMEDHVDGRMELTKFVRRDRFPRNTSIRVFLPRSKWGAGRYEVSVVMRAKDNRVDPSSIAFGFLHD